ncbi:MAG: hypothetical protein ABSE56_12780 [Bryobacteraceae bacterium]|jgi:hypothetical protein
MDWLQQWADYEAMAGIDACDDRTRPDSFNDPCDFSAHLWA